MTTDQMILASGNRIISDDGMVAWLLLRHSGLAFQHRIDKQSRKEMATLFIEQEAIINSVGIAEFVGELVPSIWPEDNRARANARSLAAEAFGGLHDFKTYLPMAITEQFTPASKLLRRTARDFAQIAERWRMFLNQNQQTGPFLFGEFSAVDAFQAPIAARCVTYGLDVDGVCESYIDAIMSYPAVAEWQALAAENEIGSQSYAGASLAELTIHSPTTIYQTSFETADHKPEDAPPSKVEAAPQKPVVATTPANAEIPPVQTITPAEPILEPAPPIPIHDDDENIPFKVDVDRREPAVEPEPAPALVRPQTPNRLFPRSGKKLFQPNYRQASADKGASADKSAGETTLERPARAAGIKPIGGEIRRRR